ncbi:glycosyltransferase [Telmatospirillum siberiense]|uniref:Glycosyl transferase n=1 Tax=Telmatospirillum siberiense TaxID=382514 RepID=A0A2N3PVD8_9PROT|nr:glycosyltransferase [Telmatospirillum siberiense]PKU24365.1 glycosyl transferase [Telmatospirillum siberiense]
MRVMQVMGSDKRGGAENFFSRLCVALGESGLAQQVVIRRDAPCKQDLLDGGITPVELPFFYSGDIATRFLLKRRIAQFAPDIVLTWMSRATSVCPTGPFVRIARLGGYYDLKYYQSCHHLIANTEEIVDYLVKHGWPREKASYLPNFVDETPVRPIDRAALQTPPDVPVILALGRLHSDKAFDVLLDAMARVPAAHLWLAGEGGLDAPLKAQAESLGIAGRVHFLGWRTDGASLLAAADCLVCPSRVEPLGNVILEGWIQKKPVVAAASTGPAGLIETERTGLIVPMEDADALAAALNRVLTDPALSGRLAEAGHAHYLARFSRKAVVELYLDFFRKMVP